MGTYVQYGCGSSCPAGWINFDSSPTLRLQRLPLVGPFFKRGTTVFADAVRYGDIISGLPIPDNSVDGIFASHVLEHLVYDDFWRALENTYRVLKPGGTFRLVVPDLEVRARSYLNKLDAGTPDANSWLMDMLGMCDRQRDRSVKGMIRSAYGNSGHRWMWDEKSMAAALKKTGFIEVRRCKLNDSEDKNFQLVEDPGRFYDHNQAFEECAMEARKPPDRHA